MNLDIYNLDAMEQAIAKLSTFHQLAFAASCCERLLPNYRAFYRENQHGNPDILRIALDEVWQFIQETSMDFTRIRQLIADCDDAVPDIDGGIYIYQAECAAMAIYYTLQACLEPMNIKLMVKVVECVGNTIDEFIRLQKDITEPSWFEKSYEEQKEEIAHHPFTVRETAKQIEDLHRLKEVGILDRSFLESLRTSFDNGGRSLIDLS
jgi:hypothetical protein